MMHLGVLAQPMARLLNVFLWSDPMLSLFSSGVAEIL